MANFNQIMMSLMRLKGFARPNRYVAFITPNPYVSQTYLNFYSPMDIMQRLAMTCFSANVPAKTIQTHEMKVALPTRNVPYGYDTNNSGGAAFDFYCLGDYFEKTIFESWQRGIVDPQTKQLDYYNNYAVGSSIYIVQFPTDIGDLDDVAGGIENQNVGSRLTGVQLTEVYPKTVTINDGALSHEAASAPLKVRVDFMYRDIIKINEPARVNIQDGIVNVNDNGNRSGGISAILSTGLRFLTQAQGFGLVPTQIF